ncbi:MAG: NADH-quinone oxidoreductase subunit C [Anaerolineales bacterium]
MNEATYIKTLQEKFGGEVIEFRGEQSLFVAPENLVAAAGSLHAMGFERLSDITAVDYWPEENPRFHAVYQFTSVQNHATLTLRVPVSGISPSLPTLEKIYPNANWREREIYDMFGIHFEGHSDLRRILMPYDWQGHPLRKDYPLGYEEPQFSFNFEEIDARKPYAKE